MSHQLTISSLVSALALVALALFARAGGMAVEPIPDAFVQATAAAEHIG